MAYEPVLIPLRPGTKEPAVRGWAEPSWRSKEDDWALDTQAALRCDGLCVIDCDTPQTAERWRSKFNPRHWVNTKRGVHFYYRMPDGERFGPIVGLFDKVDLRAGTGSYVLAPGSNHPEGGVYSRSWMSGEIVPYDYLEVLPEAVADAVRARRERTSSPTPAGSGSHDEWDQVPQGRRNDMLHAVASLLRKRGASEFAMARALLALNQSIVEAGDEPVTKDEIRVIVQSAGSYHIEGFEAQVIVEEHELMDVRTLHEPPARSWLWKPYIPDTTMTLIAGREKVGKGLFCTKLAVAVAQGELPDGTKIEPKPVLWISFEDDPELDIVPRVRALAGPDYHKLPQPIHFWHPKDKVRLPKDIDRYRDRMAEHGLVIIDPGRSIFLDPENKNFSFNNEADVRDALQQLLFLSAELRIPQLFVAHQRKSYGEGGIADTTSGTIAWRQVPRHIIDLVKVNGECALAVTQTNHFKAGFVREYSVEAYDDDHPYFVLGEERSEFPDLDAWIKAKRESSSAVVEIDEVGDIVQAARAELSAGDPFWHREYLQERFGLTQQQAKDALAALKSGDEPLVRQDGKTNRWVG